MDLCSWKFSSYLSRPELKVNCSGIMEDPDSDYASQYCPHIGLTSAFLSTNVHASLNNNDEVSTTDLESSSSASSSAKSSPRAGPGPGSAPIPLPYKSICPSNENENEAEAVGEHVSVKLTNGIDERGDSMDVGCCNGTEVETPDVCQPVQLDLVQEGTAGKSERRTSASPVRKKVVRPRCSACPGRTKTNSLWKCLNIDCGLLFCGKGACNHAADHLVDNPDHMLQQNLSSRRIWCSECNREVFDDTRNRRLAPAIWVHFPDTEPPRGLYNMGNTCFMNAALQNILAVSPLTSFFMGDVFRLDDETRSRRVARSYSWLLQEVYAQGQGSGSLLKSILPSRLLFAVRTTHPIFRGFQQHDSQEFLRLFMDSLAEETKVPHFTLETPKRRVRSEEGSENESDTDSFETCDSGNGSEEAGKLDEETMDCSDPYRSLKITMKSIVTDIFDGQVESSVQCLSCHETSRRLEVFQDLSLPIPTRDELLALHQTADKYDEDGEVTGGWISWVLDWVKSFFWGPAPSLEDCFSAFFSSDELKGKNMYSCDKCGKLRNGLKRCTLYHLPEVLCVHLKRFRMFEYPTGMGYSSKVGQYVQFPVDGLDVRPFLHKDCPDKVSDYRLMGVICHMGSVMGGHYTAFIRKGDNWFLADDCRIVPVSIEIVLECEAYVLFYQKWDIEEDAAKQELLRAWSEADSGSTPSSRFHLISRKWLTQFFWGEEAIPLDNSDVVCPHGHRVPTDSLESGSTWIPHTVWDMIITRYGGGPDLKYYEDCSICSVAWRKFQRTHVQRPSSRATSFADVSSSSDTFTSCSSSPASAKRIKEFQSLFGE